MRRTFAGFAACLSVWMMHCRPAPAQTAPVLEATGSAGETTTPDREPPQRSPQDRCSHRGPVEIRAVSPEQSRDLSTRFRQRNGPEWRVELDRFGTYVRSARRASAVGPAAAVLDREASRMALDLVRKNADLFGLSASELASLSVRAKPGPAGTLLQWDVEISGELPRAGYEEFGSVAKSIRLFVAIQRDGVVRAVSNPSELLPAFQLCTDPMLAADDPKIRAGVLGKELTYHDVGGQPRSAGKVAAGDIRSTTLTIWVDRNEASAKLHLAYELRIEKNGLPWLFFVDADTGNLIAQVPGFMT